MSQLPTQPWPTHTRQRHGSLPKMWHKIPNHMVTLICNHRKQWVWQNGCHSKIGWPNRPVYLPRIRLLPTRPRHRNIFRRLLELSHPAMYATCAQQTVTRPFWMGQPLATRKLTPHKIFLYNPLTSAHLRPSNTKRASKRTFSQKPACTASRTKDRSSIAGHTPLPRRGQNKSKHNRTRYNTPKRRANSIGNKTLDTGAPKYLMCYITNVTCLSSAK